jgi:isocitrate/isopropylmalate dehydrogenase
MLEGLGETGPAERIRTAVARVLSRKQTRTRDLGGEASAAQYVAALCSEIRA